MAAADALIEMTAQCHGAATDDGIEHLAMRPCKARSVPLPKTVARCADDVGHHEGGGWTMGTRQGHVCMAGLAGRPRQCACFAVDPRRKNAAVVMPGLASKNLSRFKPVGEYAERRSGSR